jgi:hypothetical protein
MPCVQTQHSTAQHSTAQHKALQHTQCDQDSLTACVVNHTMCSSTIPYRQGGLHARHCSQALGRSTHHPQLQCRSECFSLGGCSLQQAYAQAKHLHTQRGGCGYARTMMFPCVNIRGCSSCSISTTHEAQHLRTQQGLIWCCGHALITGVSVCGAAPAAACLRPDHTIKVQ